MRILVATDQWSPDVFGGSARVAADTARALARRGHDVVVIAPTRAGEPAVESEGSLEVRRQLRRGPFPQTVADPIETRRLARLLRDRSFDLALAHQATNAVGLSVAGLDAPLALVFHASTVLEMRFERRAMPFGKRVAALALDPALVALERRAVRAARGLLVLSRFSESIVRRRHPTAADRVHVVGGGVDATFFEPPVEPDARREALGIPPGILLLTARRLEPRMGVDLLVDAVSQLADERVVLGIAGDGSLRPRLETRIRELGLERRVKLLGRVSEADLRSLYAATDLFVLPTAAYEGFGMATVESLAQGTPVLGTAIGATPEILADLGEEFVAPDARAEVLAAAIRRLLPLLTPELRMRARVLALERYHWDVAIARWEAALTAIARG